MKIKMENEKRPCMVGELKAICHGFTRSGFAIVEFENGSVANCDLERLKFVDSDNLFSKFFFGDFE